MSTSGGCWSSVSSGRWCSPCGRMPARSTERVLPMSDEHADAYRDLRERVTVLMADVDDAALAAPSPATPEWTVHDVFAHLVGVTDDVVAGRLDGVATDEWTQKQV